MKIYEKITDLIGGTPLLRLGNYAAKRELEADLYAKLEYFNPAGSAKDRVALNMIENAEREGKLQKGSVIIEPTSGNTGIGLAAIGVSKGYKVILTMPETMSIERIKLIQAYGAKVVLTEGFKGMQGAVDKAQELKNTISGSFIAGQFTNPDNPQAHYKTTGPEIFRDMESRRICCNSRNWRNAFRHRKVFKREYKRCIYCRGRAGLVAAFVKGTCRPA